MAISQVFFLKYLSLDFVKNSYSFLYYMSKSLLNNYTNFYMLILLFFIFSHIKSIPYALFCAKYNMSSSICLFKSKLIPLALLEGYNLIHPPILYIIITYAITSALLHKCVKISSIVLLVLSLFTLWLGACWGLGNSVWGFFWVNDQIEWVLLAIIIIKVVFLHINMNKCMQSFLILSLFVCNLQLIMLRFGFDFTRHSFFDSKSLTNTLTSYILHPYVITLLLCKGLIFIVAYIYIIVVVSRMFIGSWDSFNLSYLRLYHVLLLTLVLSWANFKVNNLTYFITKKQLSDVLYASTQSFFVNNLFCVLSLKKLTLFSIANFEFLAIKKLLSILIAPSYVISFFFLVIIVSTLKIYSK